MSIHSNIEQRSYYTRRAREERDIAVVCEDNAAAIAHLSMADEYDRRLASETMVEKPSPGENR